MQSNIECSELELELSASMPKRRFESSHII